MTRFVLAALLLVAAVAPAAAQKIGYCNFQLLISKHPDATVAEQTLNTYQQKLGERFKVKESYFEAKYQEYSELAQAKKLTPEQDAALVKELERLRDEARVERDKAQADYQAKQQEVLQPIIEKVKTGVEELAKAEGYTYILNDGPKGTTVLVGPTADDVTERVAKRMNINLADAPKPAPAPGGTPAPKPAGAPK